MKSLVFDKKKTKKEKSTIIKDARYRFKLKKKINRQDHN